METGFICKRCEGPAPMGVGYADDRPGAAQASKGLDRCECGYSVHARALPDDWLIVGHITA